MKLNKNNFISGFRRQNNLDLFDIQPTLIWEVIFLFFLFQPNLINIKIVLWHFSYFDK